MRRAIYRHGQRKRRFSFIWAPLLGVVALAGGLVAVNYWRHAEAPRPAAQATPPSRAAVAIDPLASDPASGAGKLIAVDGMRNFSQSEAEAVSRQNYGHATPAVATGVTKVTFHYQSTDLDGTPVTVYGRAYLPLDAAGKLPIFAFAPGTTGIGDQCAASLERPDVVSWANYDSHMVTYASQGYAAVTTDYEGMRDPSRLHHYMVGALEGRALLDAVRAMAQLEAAKDRLDGSHVFVSGYSQGGHAAFWADTVQQAYAPNLKLSGVIGYGPVLSVQQTMNDVTRGATLDWFGPFVLTSYADYYKRSYNVGEILQPRWSSNLTSDVLSHCVDTVYGYWGHDASRVYTPRYLSAIASGTLAQEFPELIADMQKNATGTEATPSAKLINHGRYDNVVLPGQSQAAFPTMCERSKGPVILKIYPTATHYNTMVVSLADTLAWMKTITDGGKPVSNCSTPQ